MQGELRLHTEMGEHTLQAGDSIMFDSSIRHTYKNDQNTLLTFLVINYYPQ